MRNRGLGGLLPRARDGASYLLSNLRANLVGAHADRDLRRLTWTSAGVLRLAWHGFERGLDQANLDHEIAGQAFEGGAQGG